MAQKLSGQLPVVSRTPAGGKGLALDTSGNIPAPLLTQVLNNGVLVAQRRNVNLIAGTGVTLTYADHPSLDAVDVTIAATGGIGADGWTAVSGTFSYSSADGPTGVITTPSDLTGTIPVGARVKYTQTTVKYGIVTAIGSTTVTVYGGTDYTTANAAITLFSYSLVKAPFGFPLSPVKWTVKATDTSNQNTSSMGAWVNVGSLSITVPIGAWNTDYKATLLAVGAGTGDKNPVVRSTLSTGTTTETDAEFSTYVQVDGSVLVSGDQDIGTTVQIGKQLVVAAKTPYYLNVFGAGDSATVYVRGDQGTTVLRAVCAYL